MSNLSIFKMIFGCGKKVSIAIDKKYAFTEETRLSFNGKVLNRIIALKSFGEVKAGDLGGFIESEDNLSHDGNCWVYENAQVFGNARVCGDARVYENALVYRNARVFGSARVFGDAKVCGYAQVYGPIYLAGSSIIAHNCVLNYEPINIVGLKHNITVTKTHIFIGCEHHTVDFWRKNIVAIGKKHGYTDKEIKRVINCLKPALKILKEK